LLLCVTTTCHLKMCGFVIKMNFSKHCNLCTTEKTEINETKETERQGKETEKGNQEIGKGNRESKERNVQNI